MPCLRPLLCAAALASAGTATAATRNFGVNGFDRIRVEGPYRVKLSVGVPPFARAEGSQAGLDGVVVEVQGKTLVVRPNRSSWGGYPGADKGPVQIAVGTHELSAAVLNGSGALIVDRVKGLSFDLAVQGSGGATIAKVDVDQLKLTLAGTAYAGLAGRADRLTAVVRGISSVDAASLAVKDAVIGAEGSSTIRAAVSNAVKVDAQGPATIAFAGSPSCTIRAAGSAEVSGCK